MPGLPTFGVNPAARALPRRSNAAPDQQRRLAADLLGSQARDGRWRNPVGPGDEMGSAMACILLQMPRQYLPIFQR